MKKRLSIILLIVAVMTMNSCVTKYGIANIGSESKYIPKPVYKDTTEKATYLTGQFYHNLGDGYNPDELSYFGDIMINKSHTSKNFNYSYGGIFYLGNYFVNEIPKYKGMKTFYGSALTGEINFNIPFNKVDWRIIGLRTTAIYEQGSFTKFRRQAGNENLIENIHPNNATINIGLTHDLIIKLKKVSFGLYSVEGITIGADGNGILTLSNTLHFTRQRFTGFAQMSLGIFGQNGTFSAGINYRLK
jgi:hypothetical protein